jgi:hypothetical protein
MADARLTTAGPHADHLRRASAAADAATAAVAMAAAAVRGHHRRPSRGLRGIALFHTRRPWTAGTAVRRWRAPQCTGVA